ncbi:uncharacterized protein B0T15DRAFT_554948 [Chaetomium strumarium]|uniref:Uncharacterized protein n=1 Tax=Chaetomium strumarium TaxID=1170767 RepID=A0AAJ0GS62_9PEZI|nr:hypothetical protein B0T15DRAFT_554948 [Chaetomium strumarium]
MQRSNCIERERRVAVERSTKYWGTVSVDIDILEFPNEEEEENIDKLVELFQNDYRGLNPRYRIPAKIDKHQLDAALALSGLTFQKLKEAPDRIRGYPELKFPAGFRLKCCQGLHRSRAAARILPPGERCWSIDLYDSDIDPDLDAELREGYSAEKEPNDGVVYYRIRTYQGHHGPANPFLESRWWALLKYNSKQKKKNLKGILDDPYYKAAFDIQMDILALGDGMELGVIHKMFTMRCDELALKYLGHIKKVWKDEICEKNPETMQKIDRSTVKALQHTAPGCCKKDREDLWKKLQSGEIFSAFAEQERQIIWDRVLSASTTRLIPSLFTFFEDLNYLEGPLQSLKRLVPLSRKETISAALLRAYKDINQEPDQVKIQESESIMTFVPGTKAN